MVFKDAFATEGTETTEVSASKDKGKTLMNEKADLSFEQFEY